MSAHHPEAEAIEQGAPAVTIPARYLTPAEATRRHLDLVEVVQAVSPAIVAITITLAYLVQVIQTGNTDSQLGSSLPVIVAAYFVVHAGATTKRRG